MWRSRVLCIFLLSAFRYFFAEIKIILQPLSNCNKETKKLFELRQRQEK